MPPDSRVKGGAIEPRRGDSRAEAVGVGEARDRFDEVAVGVALAGHPLAEARNGVKRIGLIRPIEQGHVDIGEFEAEKLAASFQHAPGFGQRLVDPRNVANAESDRIGVKYIIGERQILRIRLDEFESGVEVAFGGALAPNVQHIAIDVEHRDFSLARARFGDAKCDVARASGHIEMAESGVSRGLDLADEDVFPDPVKANRHQIVHQIVARSHLMENGVDPRLLVLQRHAGKTEMGLFRHGLLGSIRLGD